MPHRLLLDRHLTWTALTALVLLGPEMPATRAAPDDATDAPATVYTLDLTDLNRLDLRDPAKARRGWDTLHLVASVQGIVNRNRPTLFVRFMQHPDDFWWDYLRQPGQWLCGRPTRAIASL